MREHFQGGRPVERLLERDMVKVRAEFQGHRARMQAFMAQQQQQAGQAADQQAQQQQ